MILISLLVLESGEAFLTRFPLLHSQPMFRGVDQLTASLSELVSLPETRLILSSHSRSLNEKNLANGKSRR